ncbi:unnamed protein product [Pedinophyceae sp. YPF-701]|nr:unnamed protein product [Pedinophyceae sp. YPF-701]
MAGNLQAVPDTTMESDDMEEAFMSTPLQPVTDVPNRIARQRTANEDVEALTATFGGLDIRDDAAGAGAGAEPPGGFTRVDGTGIPVPFRVPQPVSLTQGRMTTQAEDQRALVEAAHVASTHGLPCVACARNGRGACSCTPASALMRLPDPVLAFVDYDSGAERERGAAATCGDYRSSRRLWAIDLAKRRVRPQGLREMAVFALLDQGLEILKEVNSRAGGGTRLSELLERVGDLKYGNPPDLSVGLRRMDFYLPFYGKDGDVAGYVFIEVDEHRHRTHTEAEETAREEVFRAACERRGLHAVFVRINTDLFRSGPGGEGLPYAYHVSLGELAAHALAQALRRARQLRDREAGHHATVADVEIGFNVDPAVPGGPGRAALRSGLKTWRADPLDVNGTRLDGVVVAQEYVTGRRRVEDVVAGVDSFALGTLDNSYYVDVIAVLRMGAAALGVGTPTGPVIPPGDLQAPAAGPSQPGAAAAEDVASHGTEGRFGETKALYGELAQLAAKRYRKPGVQRGSALVVAVQLEEGADNAEPVFWAYVAMHHVVVRSDTVEVEDTLSDVWVQTSREVASALPGAAGGFMSAEIFQDYLRELGERAQGAFPLIVLYGTSPGDFRKAVADALRSKPSKPSEPSPSASPVKKMPKHAAPALDAWGVVDLRQAFPPAQGGGVPAGSRPAGLWAVLGPAAVVPARVGDAQRALEAAQARHRPTLIASLAQALGDAFENARDPRDGWEAKGGEFLASVAYDAHMNELAAHKQRLDEGVETADWSAVRPPAALVTLYDDYYNGRLTQEERLLRAEKAQRPLLEATWPLLRGDLRRDRNGRGDLEDCRLFGRVSGNRVVFVDGGGALLAQALFLMPGEVRIEDESGVERTEPGMVPMNAAKLEGGLYERKVAISLRGADPARFVDACLVVQRSGDKTAVYLRWTAALARRVRWADGDEVMLEFADDIASVRPADPAQDERGTEAARAGRAPLDDPDGARAVFRISNISALQSDREVADARRTEENTRVLHDVRCALDVPGTRPLAAIDVAIPAAATATTAAAQARTRTRTRGAIRKAPTTSSTCGGTEINGRRVRPGCERSSRPSYQGKRSRCGDRASGCWCGSRGEPPPRGRRFGRRPGSHRARRLV